MADDFGFQPMQQQSASQQTPAQQSDDFGFQPIPKMPDTSGIIKTVQDNLAANDNKDNGEEPKSPQAPMERLSTGIGVPVDKIISGAAKPSDINTAGRTNYLKAIEGQMASNSADFHQTLLSVGGAAINGGERAVGTLAYPFLSQENQKKLIESGKLGDIPTFTGGTGHDIAAEALTRANALLSPGMGAAWTTVASLLSPLISPIIEGSTEQAKKSGISPENASLIPSVAEFGMNLLGLGAAKGFHYAEPIVDAVAKRLDIPPASVTSEHVNQLIADGAKDLHPPPSDFKTVSTVSGIPEPALKHNYQETGVFPDQVLSDAQRNPSIATDVAAGKVPEAYEHFVEPKPTMAVEQANQMKVNVDETARSYSVTDKDGDHVRGGFDSADEAQRFVNGEKLKSDEQAALQAVEKTSVTENAVEPATEKTEQGDQQVIPGAEKISDKTLAERRMEEPLKGGNAPLEGGLFDVAGRGQGDIFDQKPSQENQNAEQKTSAENQGISSGSAVHPEELHLWLDDGRHSGGDPRPTKLYSAYESAVSDAQAGKLSQIESKAGNCFKEAGTIARDENHPMVIGTIDNGFDKRLYHAVNYVDKDGQRYIYDATFGKLFTPEVYDKLVNGFTPVHELSGEEVSAHGKEKKLWPSNTTLELPDANSIKKSPEKSAANPTSEITPKAKPQGIVAPSEIGKTTSLRSFLSQQSLKAKFNEGHEIVSIVKNGEVVKSDEALEYAHELAKEYGYMPKDLPDRPSSYDSDLANHLNETNGGREAWRDADADRVAKAKEADEARKNKDPDVVEREAHNIGLDTDPVKDETAKQRNNRLYKAIQEFYKNEQGYGDTYRKILGDTIQTVEKWTGKLTGGFFEQLAKGYTRVFQPEITGPIGKRTDSLLAKFKASLQEGVNSCIRASKVESKRFSKMTADEREEWLYDHETGRWNEEENPDHARHKAMYDRYYKEEHDAGVSDSAYKEDYLPHQYEKSDAADAWFKPDAMIKRYGDNWFTKVSEFKLWQDAKRAGLKLKTDNPEDMLVARGIASDALLKTMDLFKGMEENGAAKRAIAFGVDKKIAKTEAELVDLRIKYKEINDKILAKTKKTASDLHERYNAEYEKVNTPDQTKWNFAPDIITKKMKDITDRLNNPIVSRYLANMENHGRDLKSDLDEFNKEKANNKLTPERMAELKAGFRVIGPDSKAWMLHQQAAPIWRNAMELKGLYERQDIWGKSYRPFMAAKAIWIRAKMLASLFHPAHVAVIDVSSDMATIAHHLIQGGKISDLMNKETLPNLGLSKNTFSNLNEFLKSNSGEPSTSLKPMDHPKVVSYNTPREMRTPEQQADVDAMNEGGLVPSIPRQDAVNFKDNFDKAISGIGVNNLRLLGTALEIPSLPLAPLMENWIPGMKTDSYFQRRNLEISRDPSLLNDVGRRGEVMRGIVQDIERNYGEMNRQTQFWNPVVRDIFNAITFSGGWKLAMLQNFRGLLEPGKIAYNYAKTGEFSRQQITHNMLQSYIYTANMLMLGAGMNYLFTGMIGTIKDWMNPQTGDKNPDGTPIRLEPAAFFKEPMMLLHDINQEGGIVAGTGNFLYHSTIIPGIVNTATNRDFIGRKSISDFTDLHQLMYAGWDGISPIALTSSDRAEEKGSKTAQHMAWAGWGIAGAYHNQTPFEQKVIGQYDQYHPAEGDAYSAHLKSDLKYYTAKEDEKDIEETKAEMKREGVSGKDIAAAKNKYHGTFAEHAWNELPYADQKRLIESASPEEKLKFKLKSQ